MLTFYLVDWQQSRREFFLALAKEAKFDPAQPSNWESLSKLVVMNRQVRFYVISQTLNKF